MTEEASPGTPGLPPQPASPPPPADWADPFAAPGKLPADAAPPEEPSPWLPIIAGWMLPGLGHAMIGRKWPAIFVAGAVVPLFVGGMALAGWVNVSWTEHPWMLGAQVFAGAPTGAALLFTRGMTLAEPHPYESAGQLYTAIAGLLNLVAIADVWARCRHGDPVPAAAPHEGAGASPPADAAPSAAAAEGTQGGSGA